MKYEGGFLLMEDADIKLMSGLKLERVEKSYEVNQFLSGIAEMKDGATTYLNERLARKDKTAREELQTEIVQLFIEICDICSARAREAVADSGASIQLH